MTSSRLDWPMNPMNLTGVIMRSHTSLHSRHRIPMTWMRLDRSPPSVRIKNKSMKKRIELHRLRIDRHPVVSCSKSNGKSAESAKSMLLFFLGSGDISQTSQKWRRHLRHLRSGEDISDISEVAKTSQTSLRHLRSGEPPEASHTSRKQ
jgi:hypothetical protein